MNILKSTALYGRGFEATEHVDVYFLRIYTGGFAGIKTATIRARKEAEDFVVASAFMDFEILQAKRVWLPLSCVEFLISFRGQQQKATGEATDGNHHTAITR